MPNPPAAQQQPSDTAGKTPAARRRRLAHSGAMDALYCIFIIAALLLPFHCMVMIELEHWGTPEYFRRHGVIVKRPEALEATGEVIGAYLGAPIYRSVRFMGMEYEFAGVVPMRYQNRIDANELLLDPGLLYLTSTGELAPAGRTA
jgi:hypothetical protein